VLPISEFKKKLFGVQGSRRTMDSACLTAHRKHASITEAIFDSPILSGNPQLNVQGFALGSSLS
jgi:hypothetical protein